MTVISDTARAVSTARQEGRRVVAVGTTAVRALESAAQEVPPAGAEGKFEWRAGAIAHGSWVTEIFIRPGHSFRAVDALLTNFHQPRSTLLMLVSAFAGRELVLSCYEQAIRERYRLFSYGDCMLIL